MLSLTFNRLSNTARVCVGSTRYSVNRFNSHLIELDSDQNVGATGYDVVMQRAANIVLCNADPQMFTKVLHVYPESTFTKFMSKARNFEVVGLSDQEEGSYTYERYYSSIERTEQPFSSSLSTELRVMSFEAVANCVPFAPTYLQHLSTPTSTTSAPTANTVGTLGLPALLHVLNYRGYLVLGAPSDQFASLRWKEQLKQMDQEGRGSLISFMQLRIPVQELLDELRHNNNNNNNNSSSTSSSDNSVSSTSNNNNSVNNSSNNSTSSSNNSVSSSSTESIKSTEFVPSGAPVNSKTPCVLYSIACFRKA